MTLSATGAIAGTALATTTTEAEAAKRADRHTGKRQPRSNPFRRLQRPPTGLRARFLGAFIGLLVLAVLSSVLVTRTILLYRLDQRIDSNLTEEAAELRGVARGRDPETGRPLGTDAGRIFEIYLEREVASPYEAFITFVGGQPYRRSPGLVPYRLDRDPRLAARWRTLTQTERGRVETPAGRVEFLAVPLQGGGEAGGVFVAAVFRELADDATSDAVLAAGALGLAVLLLGSLVAWRLAGRVVDPVTELTRAARSISETDLSQRIPVRGRDEVGQLAATFNEMIDRLERAFGSQQRFIDDASHELRTPLTIVRGHLELLDTAPEAREETLALVLDELDRMGRIVEDLLLLAKHEQPDFLDLATVEVGALTEEMHAKVAALDAREWILETRGRGDVVADRQRLTQAVVQLAQNAVRFSDEGEPVAIGSFVAAGEAGFWVRDRGCGVPPEAQERIFERFGRVRSRSRSEGAGLGLAIVRAIAEAHHGRVELKSRLGEGSTFTIVVPVDPATKRIA
jgi:signal transduction histidine kinase